MVENVECLEAQLQFLRLGNLGGLRQRHIPVVEARTMEEAAAAIPELPDYLVTEERGVEVGVPVARIGIGQDSSAAGIIWYVNRGGVSAYQRVVVILRQTDGQPCGE